ncbi:MAG: hypothetical protein KA027_02690 [Candidatus Methanofastidiosum sp.]|jgi:uncharacterized membrane protein YbaN (DUF454 family)|nr:hypothetical protein [Methanofastidiosum sp.]HRZ19608.1 hypothetical protein [Methanofastidiosum sp.]
MNIRLLLGCLCIGNGVAGIITPIMYKVNFDSISIIVTILSFAAGFYILHSEINKSKK